MIYASVLIFSTVGSYVPVLWHASLFSFASILGGIIGTFFGIWVALKLKDYV